MFDSAAGRWKQSQRAFVFRSMSMRGATSSSSHPAIGYIVMGCAICGAASLVGPLVVAAAMAPPHAPTSSTLPHYTCRFRNQLRLEEAKYYSHDVLPTEEEVSSSS